MGGVAATSCARAGKVESANMATSNIARGAEYRMTERKSLLRRYNPIIVI
jgi:hypothetical protein